MDTNENRPTNVNMHWHPTMMSHGAERDAVHKFGGIAHVHGAPIDLRNPKNQSRKGLDNPLPSAYNDDNTNQEGESQ